MKSWILTKFTTIGSIFLWACWMVVLVPSVPFPSPGGVALASDEETISLLKEEIEELWETVDELEERLIEEEKKSAWDRLAFYGDFRVR